MTTADRLERHYRWLLRWYPASYRGRHEEEILGVLMAAAQPGRRGARGCLTATRAITPGLVPGGDAAGRPSRRFG